MKFVLCIILHSSRNSSVKGAHGFEPHGQRYRGFESVRDVSRGLAMNRSPSKDACQNV